MARRGGFTLIELLVVIAIIAILAAILFPVFLAAKQQANKTTCCSNLKQLSNAFQLYADDNGNTVPLNYTRQPGRIFPNGTSTFPPDYGYLWMHYIYQYVKNYKVYNCPSSTGGKFLGGYYWEGGKVDPEFAITYNNPTGPYNGSYGYNRWLGRDINEAQRVTFSQVSRATTTVLLTECPYYLTGPKWINGKNSYPPVTRHSGTMNMSFVDGHAKAVKRSDYVTNNDPSASDPIWRKWDPLL